MQAVVRFRMRTERTANKAQIEKGKKQRNEKARRNSFSMQKSNDSYHRCHADPTLPAIQEHFCPFVFGPQHEWAGNNGLQWPPNGPQSSPSFVFGNNKLESFGKIESLRMDETH